VQRSWWLRPAHARRVVYPPFSVYAKGNYIFPVLIRFKAVHIARESSKSRTLGVGSLTRKSFTTFLSLQIFYHKSSGVSIVLSIHQTGCLDFNLLFHVYVFMNRELWIYVIYWPVAAYPRISGGAIFDNTGSHCTFVDRTQPDIIFVVLFNSASTFRHTRTSPPYCRATVFRSTTHQSQTKSAKNIRPTPPACSG